MLLDVAVEVRLLAEASLAQRAPERLLLVVYVADVALEVGRDTEAALAVLAPVRLFPGVGTQVPGQVRRAGEDLPAVAARVAVSRFRRLEGEDVGQADQWRQQGRLKAVVRLADEASDVVQLWTSRCQLVGAVRVDR